MSFHNQGLLDRLLHVAVGLAMLAAGWWLWPEGLLGASLRIFGLIPLVIGAIGWSPIYALLDWTTHRPAGRRPR